MKILIVEDEPKTAAYLKKGLAEHGFTVQVANNGQDGLFQALEGSFDLVILDIGLPGLSVPTCKRVPRSIRVSRVTSTRPSTLPSKLVSSSRSIITSRVCPSAPGRTLKVFQSSALPSRLRS